MAGAVRGGQQPGRLGVLAAQGGAPVLLEFSGAFGEIRYARLEGHIEECEGGLEFVPSGGPGAPRFYQTGECRPVMAAAIGAAAGGLGLWDDFDMVVEAIAAVKGHPQLVRDTLDQLRCSGSATCAGDGCCPAAQAFNSHVLGEQNRNYQARTAAKLAGEEPSRETFTTPKALRGCCAGIRRRDANNKVKRGRRATKARTAVANLGAVDQRLLALLSAEAIKVVMKPLYLGPLQELAGIEPEPALAESAGQRGDSGDNAPAGIEPEPAPADSDVEDELVMAD